MATKRKLEFEDYNEVNTEMGNADIHGVVTSLSPVKKSKKGNTYYHGQLCDGKQSLRFVGFASSHQKMLKEFLEKRESVEIRNCQIKRSNRDSDKLELLVKGATKIHPSPKKFDVAEIEFHSTEATKITLDQVNDTQVHTIIDVDVKVLSCGEPITLGTRQKQDIKVGDATGSALVQLWEQNIGLLVEQQSYQLKQFRIVEYENVKSIAMCWEGSEVKPIDHLQNVADPPVDATVVEPSCMTLYNPKVAAVFKLETFFKCLRCGSRTEPAEGIEVRCCNKDCGILNSSNYCEKFSCAEVLFIEGQRKLALTAFGEMINELLGNSTLSPTEEELLRCPPIAELKHQNNEIVKVVRK